MLEVIRKRRSVRAYRPDAVEDEKLREVLKAAMFAPSSRGKRAWEFIVVRNEDARRKLSESTPFSLPPAPGGMAGFAVAIDSFGGC
jgi:nitroreductase